MNVGIGNSAVDISNKALAIAKKVRSKRLAEKGVKMSLGAIISEAVFETFGDFADIDEQTPESSGGTDGVEA